MLNKSYHCVFCVEKEQIWHWESANFVMNQLPKGIKWSVVPLPCSTCVCIEFFLCFCGGKQGSGPDRGQSPVEWGDFPYVRTSVPPSACSPLWAIQPEAWLARPQAWLDSPEGGTDGRMDGWMDERTNGKSSHSTGLCRCPACPHEN